MLDKSDPKNYASFTEEFEFHSTLASGQFDDIIVGQVRETKEPIVMKMTMDEKEHQNEVQILEDILRADLQGFPRLISTGKFENLNYFITNRFKMSLQDVLNKQKRLFTKKTIWQIGIEITTLLEKLHKLGYIYNDLKPDNICIGNYK